MSELYACVRASGGDTAMAIAREFSPRIERHGAGCVVFDVSGLTRLLGDAHAIGEEIGQQLPASGFRLPVAGGARLRTGSGKREAGSRELAAGSRKLEAGTHWAVAPTQVAALLLSSARPGSVVTGAAGDAVGWLPLVTLRSLPASHLPASCDRLIDTFERWGLRTLGEVAALAAADVHARMGQEGVALHRIACGQDRVPLVPDPGVPRYVESLELEWPIDTLEPLSFVLARLLDPLSASLERADRAAAALRLDLRLVDRTVHTRVVPLPAAIRDPRVLRTLLLLDLESHPPTASTDVVSIEIDPAPSRVVQYSLLERAVPSPETLATLTARLGALVGDGRCGSPAPVDTHRPDGFEMRRFEPGSALRARRDSSVSDAALKHRATGVPALRRFRPPVAVRVPVDRGCPTHVAVDRRGMPGGRVVQRAGPWRTSGAWWGGSRAVWDRDEWDVEFDGGTLCRLFRDRISGCWFLEGVID